MMFRKHVVWLIGLMLVVMVGASACQKAAVSPTADGSAADSEEQSAPVIEDTAAPAATARPEASPTPQSLPESAEGTTAFVVGDEPARGDPDAPVLIEEFSSYQCPYCARYFNDTYHAIITNFVDTGKVRYVFRDYPLPGQEQSTPASEAANCAGIVGGLDAYWQMHDLLFGNQEAWSGASDAVDMFKGYAAELGLDAVAFADCVDNHLTLAEIEEDAAEGNERGVQGTPTFFINGEPLVGAQSYDVFAQIIDRMASGEAVDVPDTTTFPTPTPATIAPVEEARILGDPNAPITLVEFSDYQCPYCARHFEETWPQIKVNFVDTGQVRYIFKDFPLTDIHPQAMAAQQAARCAGDQGNYWGMHDLLYSRQSEWSEQADPVSVFADFAGDLGLDADTLTSCVESGRWEDAVFDDLMEGVNLGVTGTPAFFIDGYPISGAQPYDLFEYALQLASEGRLGEAYRPED